MTTLAYTIVQLAATILTLADQAPKLSASAKAQFVAAADQAVAVAAWTLRAPLANVPVDVDANVEKLRTASYISDTGGHILLGVKHPITGGVMELMEEYLSFGHLDDDGLSDAMPIVRTAYPDGRATYHLAVMRNFAGAFVNTLRQPLPDIETVYSHRIADGGLHLDYKPKNAERTTTLYTVHPQFKNAPQFVVMRNPEPLLPVDRTATMGNKIASFLVFAAPWSGGVTVRSVTLNKDFDAGIRLANLRVAGSPTVRKAVNDAESELPFALELAIPAGEVRTIDVYADVTSGEPGTHASVFDITVGEAVSATGALPWLRPQNGPDVVVR
jgi:hypothetical protein